ncbi:DUF760 domain-containing protein [Prochlorothrix hollandica]|uniref:DUF760 domain-containing protein n=1 Tax=Prochlorothrix hollandica TaxID=1223 RepID=UPI000364192E
MVFSPDFFDSDSDAQNGNPLLEYLQDQSPEILSRVAKSATPDVKELVSRNVQGLLGVLPSEHFNMQVVTNRENLAGLLASAMMTGYFLRQMEQRKELEESVMGSMASGSGDSSRSKAEGSDGSGYCPDWADRSDCPDR